MQLCVKCTCEPRLVKTDDNTFIYACSDHDCLNQFNTATAPYSSEELARLAWGRLMISIEHQTSLYDQYTSPCPKCQGTGLLATSHLKKVHNRCKSIADNYKSEYERAECFFREGIEFELQQLIKSDRALRICNRCTGSGFIKEDLHKKQMTIFD